LLTILLFSQYIFCHTFFLLPSFLFAKRLNLETLTDDLECGQNSGERPTIKAKDTSDQDSASEEESELQEDTVEGEATSQYSYACLSYLIFKNING
jgi:hypothetical protein